jgi:threonine dehydratase
MTPALPLADIEHARERIASALNPTPLVDLHLDLPYAVLVKPEHRQPTGSFKIRGATNAIALLSTEQKARGVIAYSTGNHAQAVAQSARTGRTRATIVMSPDAPEDKVARTRALGASVLMAEPTSEARRRLAEERAATEGLALIPPYDDFTVMAGQGTIGLEILDETKPAAVLVPVGGGGLIAGIAAAIKARAPSVRIIGVEPQGEDDTFRSFRAGRRLAGAGPSASIADAIKVQMPGEKAFALIMQHVDDVVLVSEAHIVDAMRLYRARTGARLEPAGAVAIAAVLEHSGRAGRAAPIVCIATGENITPDRFARLAGG